VRRFAPLDSTVYFDKIVRSLEPLPEDIATWQGDHNPSWFNRGKEFVYVGLVQWTQIFRSPKPIESWTLYDMNGIARYTLADGPARDGHEAKGSGPITPADIPSGWLGGIVKGTYA
jgi:hypothetical protein